MANNESLLIVHAIKGNTDEVRRLLEEGAALTLHKDHDTVPALWASVINNRIDCLYLIIQHVQSNTELLHKQSFMFDEVNDKIKEMLVKYGIKHSIVE